MEGAAENDDRPQEAKRPIGLRYILPVSQTLIYCELMWRGLNERHSVRVSEWAPSTQLLPVQEGSVGWEPHSFYSPPPHGFRLAFALNLPALPPGMLIWLLAHVVLLDQTPFASDLFASACIGVFVPAVWFGIGWWIDERRGLSPARIWRVLIIWQEVFVARALIVSVPAFIFGLLSLIAVISRGHAHNFEILCGMLGWSGWISWASLRQAVRFRRSVRSPDPGALC